MSKFPDGWTLKKVKDIGPISRGKGISKSEVKSYGLPCVRYGEIYTTHREVIKHFNSYIDKQTAENSKKLIPGDIIFAGSGEKYEEIGKATTYLGECDAYVGGDTLILSPKDADSVYLSYLFNSSECRRQIEFNAQGSSVIHFYQQGLEKIQVKLPKVNEQKKIAEILTSVDKVIELTEIEIEKLKNLKKGMMQDLLTKGIGHTKFKDSPIGKIPESWEVKYIGDLCRVGTGGRDTQDKVEGGKYPFYVRSAQIERINTYSFDGVAILTVGDGVGTGKVFHYTEGKIEIHQRVYKLSEFNESIYPKFLFYYFSRNFLYRVEKFSAKSSVDSVRMEMITKMFTPLPTLDEQIKIANACQSIEKTIESKELKLERNKNMKKGLMQDLLTGKVRVKV